MRSNHCSSTRGRSIFYLNMRHSNFFLHSRAGLFADLFDVENPAAAWEIFQLFDSEVCKGDWNNRNMQYSVPKGAGYQWWSSTENINDASKNKTMHVWCLLLSLVCSGLPACRAYSVLIEVTEGTCAAGSQPDKTDFMARLQRLLVPENALNYFFFSGFTSLWGEAVSNLGDFSAAEHRVKFTPRANNSSWYAPWFYCAHKAGGWYSTVSCLWWI